MLQSFVDLVNRTCRDLYKYKYGGLRDDIVVKVVVSNAPLLQREIEVDVRGKKHILKIIELHNRIRLSKEFLDYLDNMFKGCK